MPIYEYECLNCNKIHERVQKFTDKPLTTCSECGGRLRKIISNTSFILKGTGWYKTDYASSLKRESKDSKKKSEAMAEAKTETKSESKTEVTAKA